MSYEFYSLKKEGNIAWIFLDRAEKKNAMNPPAWKELIPIFEDIDNDENIRVSIIASSGETFCAGIDLIGMMPTLPELMDKEQKGGIKLKLIDAIYKMQDGLTCIERSKKPVIAAVNNLCIGAGLDMISACDIRLCTEDAKFSLREVAVAFVADMGVLQRLPNIVGQGVTRELAYTAKYIDARRAKDVNLINEIYADKDSLLKAAEEMAKEIVANSPIAVQATKNVLNQAIETNINDGLKYNASMSANVIPSNDLFEAVTAFTQKRKPEFTGS